MSLPLKAHTFNCDQWSSKNWIISKNYFNSIVSSLSRIGQKVGKFLKRYRECFLWNFDGTKDSSVSKMHFNAWTSLLLDMDLYFARAYLGLDFELLNMKKFWWLQKISMNLLYQACQRWRNSLQMDFSCPPWSYSQFSDLLNS